mmetsp:Transcript_13434/g.34453  ORF Transcript_13434/g.34453 Transcript_13434/m.34453 type:complete len:83 (-) Transcript_13434:1133-1381(-)
MEVISSESVLMSLDLSAWRAADLQLPSNPPISKCSAVLSKHRSAPVRAVENSSLTASLSAIAFKISEAALRDEAAFRHAPRK